jgi:uncharacterized SAM-binding protein YcdF (DUF218 family)
MLDQTVIEANSADAIVVLGCTVHTDGSPSAALLRRLALAVRAFHAKVAPRVIASGGRRWGAHVEALVMRDTLIRQDVPASAIDVELLSLTTSENCHYTAELLRRDRSSSASVFVATCGWHLPRAVANFQRCGVQAVLPPADWFDTPDATLYQRARERVCALVDSCMMPRAQ